jgi:DNA-binding transcriptional LysR family regulator
MRTDINLFIVFNAIAETRSVTLAAKRLSLSQSAISHALNRLRVMLGDQLFMRSPSGLQPTARSVVLIPKVKSLLRDVDYLIAQRGFDPAREVRHFRIATSEYSIVTLAPPLIEKISKRAPHVVLELVPFNADTLQHLENGTLDLSFWASNAPPEPYFSQVLFKEHYIGIMSQNHVLARNRRVSLKQFLDYPHIIVSLRDPGQNLIDEALSKLQLHRKTSVISHSFLGNMECVRNSDMLAAIPSRLYRGAACEGLVKFKIPLDLPGYNYSICWHARTEADASAKWLRENIMTIVGNAA